jgi:hypothetical protein
MGKLARYANGGEGASFGALGRALVPPVADSSDEDEEEEAAPARTILNSADHVLKDEEESMAIQHVAAISEEAEARACFLHEEADAVRQARDYEATQRRPPSAA